MLKKGDTLAENYTIVSELEKIEETEYYLVTGSDSRKYVAAVRNIPDEDERREYAKKIRKLSHLKSRNFLPIVSREMEADQVVTIISYSEGRPLKELLITSGPMDRKSAIKLAVQLTEAVHGAAVETSKIPACITVDQIWLDRNDVPELLGIDRFEDNDSVSTDREADLVFQLGLVFYQICTGILNDSLIELRYNRDSEVPVVPRKAGRRFSELIENCLSGGYDKLSTPLTRMLGDLKKCRILDGLSSFVSGDSQEMPAATPGLTNVDPGQFNVIYSNQGDAVKAEQEDHPTTRLGQEEAAVPKKKFSGQAGKFIITKNEIWVHTGEIIQYGNPTGTDY